MGDKLANWPRRSSPGPGVLFYYEGGEVPEELKSKITFARVGPQVTCISDGAFFDCKDLAGVHLNEGLQVIGAHAFEDCTSLATVELIEGLQIIGKNVLAGCTSLRSVALPSTITELYRFAFCECSNLVEVRPLD